MALGSQIVMTSSRFFLRGRWLGEAAVGSLIMWQFSSWLLLLHLLAE